MLDLSIIRNVVAVHRLREVFCLASVGGDALVLIGTDTVFGDESLSSSKLGVDPGHAPSTQDRTSFATASLLLFDHHHVAVTAHTAISQEPEIGLGAILVQPVHVEFARMIKPSGMANPCSLICRLRHS